MHYALYKFSNQLSSQYTVRTIYLCTHDTAVYARTYVPYARTCVPYARTYVLRTNWSPEDPICDGHNSETVRGISALLPLDGRARIVDYFHPGYDLLQAILKRCVRIGSTCFLAPIRTHPLPHHCNWIKGDFEDVASYFRVRAIILK